MTLEEIVIALNRLNAEIIAEKNPKKADKMCNQLLDMKKEHSKLLQERNLRINRS